jgi:hypothetical protein
MSPERLTVFAFGLLSLLLIATWLTAEIKNTKRIVRVSAGIAAGLSFSFGLLALSNSIGSYYSELREHRTLQALIRSFPAKSAEIKTWSSNYKYYTDSKVHAVKLRELDNIIGE